MHEQALKYENKWPGYGANPDPDVEIWHPCMLALYTYSNLIIPAGVSLIPGILNIRILKAEDLPQMDMGKRSSRNHLVDPYCVVRYAEHKEIKTDTVKKDHDPVWNTEIRIPTNVSILEDD